MGVKSQKVKFVSLLKLTNIFRYSDSKVVSVEVRNLIVDVGDDDGHVGGHDVVAESGFVFKNLACTKLESVEAALRKNCLKICSYFLSQVPSIGNHKFKLCLSSHNYNLKKHGQNQQPLNCQSV